MLNFWKNKTPNLQGRLQHNVSLKDLTWIKAGGIAQVLFHPKSQLDLQTFVSSIQPQIPIYPLGASSNFLLRDGGFPGAIIKIGSGFRDFSVKDNLVTAQAGMLLPHLAAATSEKNLSGLEFLIGIPGTVGGAVRMNAGAHNRNISNALVSALVMHRDASLEVYTNEKFQFKYRQCSLPHDSIILEATFQVASQPPGVSQEVLSENLKYRNNTQPRNVATCGCAFKNPEGCSAWKLIKESMDVPKERPAQFSEVHYNFLINTGGATASDIESLVKETQKKVLDKKGVLLTPELVIVGEHRREQNS